MKCCEEGEIERGKGVWVGGREVKKKEKKRRREARVAYKIERERYNKI